MKHSRLISLLSISVIAFFAINTKSDAYLCHPTYEQLQAWGAGDAGGWNLYHHQKKDPLPSFKGSWVTISTETHTVTPGGALTDGPIGTDLLDGPTQITETYSVCEGFGSGCFQGDGMHGVVLYNASIPQKSTTEKLAIIADVFAHNQEWNNIDYYLQKVRPYYGANGLTAPVNDGNWEVLVYPQTDPNLVPVMEIED